MRTLASALLAASLLGVPALAEVQQAPHLAREFPLVDQLHEPTSDGHPSENARNNCVPTSVAAALTYLLGKPYNGDLLKHAVYGGDYLGMTSPGRFVAFARSQGVLLKRVTAPDQEALVAELRSALARGVPALVAMPAAWRQSPDDPRQPNAPTHVGVAVDLDPQGRIRVMNPWGGFWQVGDDDYWAARLCYGELWTLERLDGANPRPLLVQHERPSKPSAAAAPTE